MYTVLILRMCLVMVTAVCVGLYFTDGGCYQDRQSKSSKASRRLELLGGGVGRGRKEREERGKAVYCSNRWQSPRLE